MKFVRNDAGDVIAIDLNEYHFCKYCNKYITSKNFDYHNSGVKHNLNKKLNKKLKKRVQINNKIFTIEQEIPKPPNQTDQPIYLLKSNIQCNI